VVRIHAGEPEVTIRHLLTMTSGMKWDETYTNPNSDNVRLRYEPARLGSNATISYLRSLTRQSPAGTKWLYNSGDTELIGVLLTQATGKTLSAYLSEKVWKPYGMEQSAYWDLTPSGIERSGGGLSVTLRDYARFGQFILDGAKVPGGTSIVPPDWLAQATMKQVDIGVPGRGYGYFPDWTLSNSPEYSLTEPDDAPGRPAEAVVGRKSLLARTGSPWNSQTGRRARLSLRLLRCWPRLTSGAGACGASRPSTKKLITRARRAFM
jgi:CubicO group peptidase (beta-lactamase class C family)